MISVVIKGLSLLQFNNLTRFPELLHFSTVRTGGVSELNYSSLNLGLNSGDSRDLVMSNRKTLCAALQIDKEQLIFPKQTHTATVRVITDSFLASNDEEKKVYLLDTDAIITALAGICIAVKTADCVPVLLYDPKRKVIAAIHAGWRGTAQNIVLLTIQKMVMEFGSSPEDLIAGIGPSISPAIYEVGKEVYSKFEPRFYNDSKPARTEKRMLDLWKANHHQLILGGLNPLNIETAQICTLSDPERFYSARRDGAKTGRMATGIMLRG